MCESTSCCVLSLHRYDLTSSDAETWAEVSWERLDWTANEAKGFHRLGPPSPPSTFGSTALSLCFLFLIQAGGLSYAENAEFPCSLGERWMETLSKPGAGWFVRCCGGGNARELRGSCRPAGCACEARRSTKRAAWAHRNTVSRRAYPCAARVYTVYRHGSHQLGAGAVAKPTRSLHLPYVRIAGLAWDAFVVVASTLLRMLPGLDRRGQGCRARQGGVGHATQRHHR